MDAVQTERRKSGRFKVGKGAVFFRSTGLSSVVGELKELCFNGCKCLVSLDGLGEVERGQWNEVLSGGRTLYIDLSARPFLSPLHLAVVVRHILPENGALKIGLEFLSVEADERQVLDAALSSYQTDRPVRLKSSTRLSAFVQPAPNATGGSDTPPPSSGKYPSVQSADENKGEVSPRSTTRVLKNWFASPEAPSSRESFRGKRLGQILVLLGKVNAHDVEDAQKAAKAMGEKVGRYFLRGGWITPQELCSALSIQTGLPMTDISELEAVAPKLVQVFSCLTLLRYECVPFAETPDAVHIAATHPLLPTQIKELESRGGKKVELFLGEDDQIIRLLHALQPKRDRRLSKLIRYKITLPVSYRFFNRKESKLGDEVFLGRTVNISESGLLMGVEQDIRNQGSCVHVSFTFAPQQVEGLCSVRYVRKSEAKHEIAEPYVVGLQIFDMTEESRVNLKSACIRLGMWNSKKLGRTSAFPKS